MLRFLRRHPPKESEGRESQKKELFGFRRVSVFPLLHYCRPYFQLMTHRWHCLLKIQIVHG